MTDIKYLIQIRVIILLHHVDLCNLYVKCKNEQHNSGLGSKYVCEDKYFRTSINAILMMRFECARKMLFYLDAFLCVCVTEVRSSLQSILITFGYSSVCQSISSLIFSKSRPQFFSEVKDATLMGGGKEVLSGWFFYHR